MVSARKLRIHGPEEENLRRGEVREDASRNQPQVKGELSGRSWEQEGRDLPKFFLKRWHLRVLPKPVPSQ